MWKSLWAFRKAGYRIREFLSSFSPNKLWHTFLDEVITHSYHILHSLLNTYHLILDHDQCVLLKSQLIQLEINKIKSSDI